MRINAYILAADPAWIEASVLSYYDLVDKIIVSYDETKTSWTGTPIAVDECLERLRAIDRDNKMCYSPKHYARLNHKPMENETYQRQCALDEASTDADWVLQFDTDEVLPDFLDLLKVLNCADAQGIPAVEWPMRVLFHTLPDGRFLEVCAADGSDHFEYPGPIAVRPGAKLKNARRVEGAFLRPVVAEDNQSLQVKHPVGEGETRTILENTSSAILHQSWARSPESIRSKIASWGHNEGLRSQIFYYLRWRPAPYLWRVMRDFHPFARGLWPALKPCEAVGLPVSQSSEKQTAL